MNRIGRPPSCECGTCSKCKHAAYMREWYRRKTPDERRAWVARRDPDTQRRNDEKRKETQRRRASQRAASKRQARRNRLSGKMAARSAVAYAVRTGKMTRQPCDVCGEKKTQAHHHLGYAREHYLDVRWLCVPHHKAVHGHLRPDYPLAVEP